MPEEKNKQNKKEEKKEECPLCKVSEETIEKLKEKEAPLKIPETRKKSPWKFKVWFLIFVLAAAGFAFYQLTGGENPIQEQSAEKNQASIFDIISGGIEVGDLAPDFVSEDVYGNEISLSDFQGEKPVLLVFWATWCGYCAQELPNLIAFTSEYQEEIQVIAVSSGESQETISDYIQEKDVNFLMLLDENRDVWNEYLIRGTPSHFLIDKEGKIISLRPGLASTDNLEVMLTMLK